MKAIPTLLAPLLAVSALAAPSGTDVERTATRTAQVLGGVLRNCPASFASIGSAQKRCVGTGNSVEQARVQLETALGADLYGVWRSRDGQRSVYNWLRTPDGYVYLRLQPDPEGRAQTLVYLDLPPRRAPTTGRRENSMPPTRPAPSVQPLAVRSPTPLPFTRTLQLTIPRMKGADVRAVQNRLIRLTRPSSGGEGDGWYGPVTAATVRAFQAANALPVTGRVDRTTWATLFSPAARPFPAASVR